MNQIISGFQAVLGARLGVPGPSEDHTGTSDSLSSPTFHSPLWGSRKLLLPSSDQSVGELHGATIRPLMVKGGPISRSFMFLRKVSQSSYWG